VRAADVRHIVDNYESLAERTVFMQGKLPSCGFFLSDGTTGSHLMTNVSMEDYLLEPYHTSDAATSVGLGGFFMPITMVINANLTQSTIRSSFAPPTAGTPRPAIPRPVPHMPRGDAGDHWLAWERNLFIDFIHSKVRGESKPMPYGDFFRKVTGGRVAPPELPFAQGAQFAASAAAIRRTPKATYQWLLAQMESGKQEITYYLELSWLFLLGGGQVVADHVIVPDVPKAPTRAALHPFLSHLVGDGPDEHDASDRPRSREERLAAIKRRLMHRSSSQAYMDQGKLMYENMYQEKLMYEHMYQEKLQEKLLCDHATLVQLIDMLSDSECYSILMQALEHDDVQLDRHVECGCYLKAAHFELPHCYARDTDTSTLAETALECEAEQALRGCTVSLSLNYKPSASVDDGSCIIPGCTDPTSSAFMPMATYDDGSCPISIVFEGCTDSTAANYYPQANHDDGSCLHIYPGCMDPTALNYDQSATAPGPCILPIPGCTDSSAENYLSIFQIDNGGCLFRGCTDSSRANYNPLTNLDDGLCTPLFPGGLLPCACVGCCLALKSFPQPSPAPAHQPPLLAAMSVATAQPWPLFSP